MTLAVYLAVYCGLLIFAGGCIRRIVQYARMPLHLRWELYPVPHEDPEHAAHGGSYFEAADWWRQPQKVHLAGELRVMIPEMLFLKGLWDCNRRLWYVSFPFHFGLYLSIGSAVLATVKAALAVVAPAAVGAGFGQLLALVCRTAGIAGSALVMVGAAGLFYRRKINAELRNFTAPADLFNLTFFIVTFGTLTAGFLARPAGTSVGAVIAGMMRFDAGVAIGNVFGVGVMMASALAAYIPFTHMAHFIAKYFTYHVVRWDDRLNVRGGRMEVKLAEYLAYRPNWGAAHIGADGEKTWAEIAAASPAQGVRK